MSIPNYEKCVKYTLEMKGIADETKSGIECQGIQHYSPCKSLWWREGTCNTE